MKLSPGFSFVPSMSTEKDAPPLTPYTALLWAQTSTVAPPVGPRSLTFLCPAIRWVSVGTARPLMQFHNTQQHLALSSRPPAARVAEAAHRGSVASSAFQWEEKLLSLSLQQHRRQPPRSSLQVLEPNEALVVRSMWNNHLVLSPICIPYNKGGWGISGAAPDCKQPRFKGLRLWLCWITLCWMKSRWCFETSQKRRSRIPSRRFLIVMRQWVIYSV